MCRRHSRDKSFPHCLIYIFFLNFNDLEDNNTNPPTFCHKLIPVGRYIKYKCDQMVGGRRLWLQPPCCQKYAPARWSVDQIFWIPMSFRRGVDVQRFPPRCVSYSSAMCALLLLLDWDRRIWFPCFLGRTLLPHCSVSSIRRVVPLGGRFVLWCTPAQE